MFVVCNNFPHVAFTLAGSYDPSLATALGLDNLTAVWESTVVHHAAAETAVPINGTGFFNLVRAHGACCCTASQHTLLRQLRLQQYTTPTVYVSFKLP